LVLVYITIELLLLIMTTLVINDPADIYNTSSDSITSDDECHPSLLITYLLIVTVILIISYLIVFGIK